jgi:ABC-2 type transport system ATP-binding protein
MIQFSDVNQWYKQFHVLKDVSLHIKKGEVCVIAGRNGAGKSTFFETILGLLPGYTGTVKVLGEDIAKSRKWMHKISFLPEKFQLYPQLTVFENLEFFTSLQKGHIDDLKKVLDLTGMSIYKDKKIKDLSKGMLQRLGLSLAFLGKPEFIILDEPTSGIDPQGRLEIIEIIHSLNQLGITIIFSSHHLSEIERVGTHVIKIENQTIEKMSADQYLSDFYSNAGLDPNGKSLLSLIK